MPGPLFRRGDIYWGDLDPSKGSEQRGRRPVIVFQTDDINHLWNAVIIIPLTTTLRRGSMPTCVPIPGRPAGCLKIPLPSGTTSGR